MWVKGWVVRVKGWGGGESRGGGLGEVGDQGVVEFKRWWGLRGGGVQEVSGRGSRGGRGLE